MVRCREGVQDRRSEYSAERYQNRILKIVVGGHSSGALYPRLARECLVRHPYTPVDAGGDVHARSRIFR
jgi:hypothetical protein